MELNVFLSDLIRCGGDGVESVHRNEAEGFIDFIFCIFITNQFFLSLSGECLIFILFLHIK